MPMTVDVERRARMHAALGEPVRLAIVDRLAYSDASPGELSARFALPTNLLAHHLKVLDDAGLVRRVRSEGDRRRQYVQVRFDDPTVAALTGNGDQAPSGSRVVFLCTANSARSQLATAVWRRISSLPVTSAGTHPAERVHPRAVQTGRRHGLDLAAAGTSRIGDVVQPGDLLVAVCDNAHEELATDRSAPRASTAARLHWHIADPVRVDTDQAFETAYREITERVTRLAAALT